MSKRHWNRANDITYQCYDMLLTDGKVAKLFWPYPMTDKDIEYLQRYLELAREIYTDQVPDMPADDADQSEVQP